MNLIRTTLLKTFVMSCLVSYSIRISKGQMGLHRMKNFYVHTCKFLFYLKKSHNFNSQCDFIVYKI